MKSLQIYLCLIAVLFFQSCSNQKAEPEEIAIDLSQMKAIPSVDMAGKPDESISTETLILPKDENAKIIKTADVRFQVEKLNEGVEAVKKNVKSVNGYITNSNQSRSELEINVNLTIRVPSTKFDSLLNNIMESSVYTDYKNISTQDVTEEFIDTEARTKAKKALEQRYLELLKQAKNVKEILEVEEQLGKIREEIESKEGRLKYLKDQVAFSTITLTIYQKLEQAERPDLPFYSKIWNNLKGGLSAVVEFFIGIFYYVPFILLALGAIYLFRRWWRNRR